VFAGIFKLAIILKIVAEVSLILSKIKPVVEGVCPSSNLGSIVSPEPPVIAVLVKSNVFHSDECGRSVSSLTI